MLTDRQMFRSQDTLSFPKSSSKCPEHWGPAILLLESLGGGAVALGGEESPWGRVAAGEMNSDKQQSKQHTMPNFGIEMALLSCLPSLLRTDLHEGRPCVDASILLTSVTSLPPTVPGCAQ